VNKADHKGPKLWNELSSHLKYCNATKTFASLLKICLRTQTQHQVAAHCNVTRGPLVWHAIEFAETSAILEFYYWFRFWPQSTCHSAPVCEILSKSDRPRQKKYVLSIFKMADFPHSGL